MKRKSDTKFHRFICFIFSPLFHFLYRLRVVGRENEPENGGFLVCSNHLSAVDPILITAALSHQVCFMGKKELFKIPLLSSLIRALGAFPVERGAGDGRAIKNGEDILREGNVMTIFIEGTRTKTGDLLRPRSGCALLAQQMQLPVVPCCITKKNFFHKFSKTIVHFGNVLTPEQLGLTPDGGRRELKNATGVIMGEIKKMREEDEQELKNS